MKTKPLALILGAGTGLGESLCAVFDAAGYQVVGINRSVGESSFDKRIADLTNHEATQQVLNKVIEQFGAPEVVVHNTAQLTIKPFLDTSNAEFSDAWQSMPLSLFNTMQCLLPSMLTQGKGSIIVSGATASIRGGNKFSAFASAKFALRGLTQSLAREYQNQGIHIAHVLLDGIIDTPRSRELHSLDPVKMLNPDDIAQQYLALATQPKSVWTNELDLRPSSENF